MSAAARSDSRPPRAESSEAGASRSEAVRPDAERTEAGPPGPIRVLIVDDQALVRQGVRAFLETRTDLTIVADVGSGREAIEAAVRTRPHVALIDLVMPGMDGIATTVALREHAPACRVVVLTSHHDDGHVYPALRAGALGYLLKSVTPEELAAAIRAAAHGEPSLHPRVAMRLVQDAVGRGPDRPGSDPDRPEPLTPREREVLAHVAEGVGNAEIAARLGLSEKTVKGHVSHLLAKLRVKDRTQAAVYAWREGLVRRDD